MRTWIKAGSLVLLLILFSGCSSNDVPEIATTAATTEATTVTETEPVTEPITELETEPEPVVIEPAFGGVLNLAMSPAKTLDPLENKVANVEQVLNLVYESLFTLDETLRPVPLLVESYEFQLDGRSLKLVLKSDVAYHNGMMLTAEDVAFTIDAIKDSKTSPYRSLVMPIKRHSVQDAQTILFYYDEPYAFMLQDLVFPVVSKAYFDSETFDPSIPVGTGPYSFVEYQDMQHLDLTAYSEWHKGEVLVENIHVVVMNETSNLETLFDQHIIDLMAPDKFNWLKYSEKPDQRIETYQTGHYDFIGFNQDNKILQDVDLRKAFAYAINREEILYSQFINHGTIVDTPVIPGSWFDSDEPLTYDYSPDLALTHLNGQVYKDNDGDGFYDQQDVLNETLFKTIELVMLVNENSAVRTAVAPKLEAYIEAIGFSVTVDIVDSETYYERIQSGDFDLLYGGWKLSAKPDFISLFASEGSQNWFGYESQEMDLVLQSLVSSYNDIAVKQRVEEFEDLMIEEMPYVSLYFLEGAIMSRSNVYGELNPTVAEPYNKIDTIYMDLTKE